MLGPEIVARSMTLQRIADKFGNEWQYHPRSDRHSKVACWVVLLDLLLRCALLRRHASEGKVAFGINHTMIDFTNGRQKNLDLVLCEPRSSDTPSRRPVTFADLADRFEVALTSDEQAELLALPPLYRRDVGDVLLALEAKACMTAHQKAGPRLYDELTSAWNCINGSAPQAIAVGFGMVNASEEFISPDRNRFSLAENPPVVNTEPQPAAALGAHERIRALRVRGHVNERGYDAVGILTVLARNDSTPIALAPSPPGLSPSDPLHYERMIFRTAGLYDGRFAAR